MDRKVGTIRIEAQGSNWVVQFTHELPARAATELAAHLLNLTNMHHPTEARTSGRAKKLPVVVVAPSGPGQSRDDLALSLGSGQGDLVFALLMIAAGAVMYAACVRYLL